jgi:hypothetical protein
MARFDMTDWFAASAGDIMILILDIIYIFANNFFSLPIDRALM